MMRSSYLITTWHSAMTTYSEGTIFKLNKHSIITSCIEWFNMNCEVAIVFLTFFWNDKTRL